MKNAIKFTLGIFIICIVLITLSSVFLSKNQSADTVQTFWQFQSIDTMKYSRDAAGDKTVLQKIPFIVKSIADMKATHIAIATPYDERFYPVLSAWVMEARKYNLHVWFRGNFSAWEGWFGYDKLNNPEDDHAMVRKFITKHPELFKEGDIFTPVPEPENGVIGDPRGSDQKSAQFNQFLIDSYNNCVASFAVINKNIRCGYFSMNGDIAKQVLTKDTVEKIGNVVVIDHYVDSPEKMGQALEYLHNKFNTQIVLGEFGAPIPDINGDMNPQEQADFVGKLLQEFYLHRNIVEGINYWVIAGGSTSLLNDDFSPRPVTNVISGYFSPNVWRGKITDTAGDVIFNANIQSDNQSDRISFANNGEYSIVTPNKSLNLVIRQKDYGPQVLKINFDKNKEISQSVVLEPINPDFWYSLRVFLKKFFLRSV